MSTATMTGCRTITTADEMNTLIIQLDFIPLHSDECQQGGSHDRAEGVDQTTGETVTYCRKCGLYL